MVDHTGECVCEEEEEEREGGRETEGDRGEVSLKT